MSWSRRILLLLVCGQLWWAPLSWAAGEKPPSAPDAGGVIYPRRSGNSTESTGSNRSDYTYLLVVALLMGGAGAWLFWRGRTAPRRSVDLRKLAIAETKSLGNRQYLVVASYENKKFLLGVCPGRIDLLTPLEAPVPTDGSRT